MRKVTMKKHFLKSVLIFASIIAPSSMLFAHEAKESLTAAPCNHDDFAQLREEFEQNITEVRAQIEQIGYATQQIILAIYADKVGISPSQKEKVLNQLEDIRILTDVVLNKLLTQTTADVIPLGLHINSLLAKYLLKAVSTNFTPLGSEKLHRSLENCLNKESYAMESKQILLLIEKNKSTIAELIHKTDFIGLTWYNKSYRFLKNCHAYDIARGTMAVLTASLVVACVYKTYFNEISTDKSNDCVKFFDSIIGTQSKYILDEAGQIQLGKNGRPIEDGGSGLLKIWENYKSLVQVGILAPLGLSLPIKNWASDIYSQYWDTAKRNAIMRWKKFDAICSGADNIPDAHDCEKVYFNDMTGAEHLAELAQKITNYLLHPERYERIQMEEHRGILLHGPPQTGKTLFAKALKTMIDENLNQNKKMTFIDVKKILDIDRLATIDEIFYYAKSVAPCILFIDEIDIVGAHREKDPVKAGQLLTNMQGIDMVTNKIFVIAATNKLEQIDKSLLVDGRFGKIIHIDYPNYQHRKLYLEQQLLKRSINLDPAFLDQIAQESEGASYNKLKRIITEALIFSTIALRPVTEDDFEKALDSEIRHVEKLTTNLSAQEKRVIAIYQAGKALMRHLLQDKQDVVKVTILPVAKNVKTNEHGWALKTDHNKQSDNDKLAETQKDKKSKNGEVFIKSCINDKTLLSDDDYKKEAFCLLAGSVAHTLLCKQTFSQCNPQDRADAIQIIHAIIAQGESADKVLRAKALELKERYDKEIEAILANHKDLLEQIIEKLVTNNSINHSEWQELMKDCPKLA